MRSRAEPTQADSDIADPLSDEPTIEALPIDELSFGELAELDLPATDSIRAVPPPTPRAELPKPRAIEDSDRLSKQDIARQLAQRRTLEEVGRFADPRDGEPGLEAPAELAAEKPEGLRSELKALGYIGSDDRREDLQPGLPEAELDRQVSLVRARAFLDGYRQLEGLELLEPTGYWANTYLPGDPALRYLHRRLTEPDGRGRADRGRELPHTLARRPASPADPPARSALAVRLHADQRAVDGPRRVRLRVGLEATERRGGRRSAMRLAVVLHSGEAPLPARDAARVRAYLLALARAREVGDRFSLFVAGGGGHERGERPAAPEPPALDESHFRHGPLVDLCDRLFAARSSAGSTVRSGEPGSATALRKTLEWAIARVALDDDPTAPVGSSAVLLVNASPLGEAASLLPAARAAARAGISLSTVDALGASTDEDTATLEGLTFAGHGRAYVLGDTEPVERQVERELSAASRAVARAVRLNLRLAEGVGLVRIFGSRRLDAESTRHTRAAEASLDRRLASSLGIASDRGEDDAGIQILIPAFYAGDSHALLLDLAVPGPGEVAEVTARYKDLIHLENSVARAHLALDRGTDPPGPAQICVIEELLAHHLAGQLDGAAAELEGGEAEAAVGRLRRLRQTLAGLPAELPALQASRALEADLQLADAYLRGLEAERPTPDQVSHWIASLRYASLLETQPRPEAGPGSGLRVGP